MRIWISTAIVSGFLLAAPVAQAAKLENADKAAAAMNIEKMSFVKTVESSNAFEIESSRIAEKKASAGDVKEFARQMVADHTKAGEALKKAAKLSGDAKPELAPKHAAMLKLLDAASGDEFQALYIDMQTVAHMEAVTLFATYAKGGDDEAVKTFAEKTLPTLEMHKSHVMKLVAAH